jgi:SAM-dependent methyltransferase
MNLAQHIQSNEYERQRIQPRPGDESYLHLSDLRLAMDRIATDRPLVLLDYGCGGSPYRSLFPNADYRRADFLHAEGDTLDYLLDETSKVNEQDAIFDLILSTQVLEHVADPEGYLNECRRLLKKGGGLYLTTHGIYPDHGCPYDFRRWTADGLVADLRRCGFEIERIEKQTTGPRAFFAQLEYQDDSFDAPRRTLFGMIITTLRALTSRARPWLHRMCDRYFARHRVVTDALEQHRTYVVVACLARKA